MHPIIKQTYRTMLNGEWQYLGCNTFILTNRKPVEHAAIVKGENKHGRPHWDFIARFIRDNGS